MLMIESMRLAQLCRLAMMMEGIAAGWDRVPLSAAEWAAQAITDRILFKRDIIIFEDIS